MPKESEVLTESGFMKKLRDDADFRAEVEADARSAIGGALPPQVDSVRVVEDTGGVVHFVFPPDPNGELSDEALSGTSGGVNVAQFLRPDNPWINVDPGGFISAACHRQ